MDLHELANAWTMVPFFYFTWYSKTLPQSILITLMWMSSIRYHLHYAMHQVAIGHLWHLLDCTFQVATLLVLVLEAPAYAAHPIVKQISSMCFTLLLGWMWGAAFGHLRNHLVDASQLATYYPIKETVFHTTVFAHAFHLMLCIIFAPHRASVVSALQTLLPFPLIIIASCRDDGRYWWSIGHGVLFWYTYHCWKSLGMLRTT